MPTVLVIGTLDTKGDELAFACARLRDAGVDVLVADAGTVGPPHGLEPDVSREAMIRGICRAHALQGQAYQAGLGFYSGRRFHVDSSGFRKWGPDGSGATSPCVSYA